MPTHSRREAPHKRNCGVHSLAVIALWATAFNVTAPAAYANDTDAKETAAPTFSEALVSDGGSFRIRWASSPQPLPFNEYFELLIEVQLTADSQDSNPLWLDVHALMPEHAHGMNTQPKIQALDDGRFIVKGMLFHMAGSWELSFDVAKGRIREQAKTRLQVD